MNVTLYIIFVLGVIALFANGFIDAIYTVSTVIATRVLRPRQAVIWAEIFNTLGAIFTGTAVASTIGYGFLSPSSITIFEIIVTLITIILWTIISRLLHLYGSKTFEMIAGLAGAGLATTGPSGFLWNGLVKICIGTGLIIFVNFIFSFVLTNIIGRYFIEFNPRNITRFFKYAQFISSTILDFFHGGNDGQKFMGIFSISLLLGGVISVFQVPHWVTILCGVILGIGTLIGGWLATEPSRFILRRLGTVTGFTIEASAGLTIFLGTITGIPISTIYSIIFSSFGVTGAYRFPIVHWDNIWKITFSWFLTIICCMTLGYLLTKIYQLLSSGVLF